MRRGNARFGRLSGPFSESGRRKLKVASREKITPDNLKVPSIPTSSKETRPPNVEFIISKDPRMIGPVMNVLSPPKVQFSIRAPCRNSEYSIRVVPRNSEIENWVKIKI